MKRATLTFLGIILMSGVAVALPAGSAVVAKPTGDAVIIWQATPEVARLVAAKTPEADALAALEDDALLIMQSKNAEIDKKARTVAVNVIYERTGDVSPIYRSVTFEGFEHLLTLKATRTALNHSALWAKAIAARQLPTGVTVQMTGSLPK